MGSEGERMDTPEEMEDACAQVCALLQGENLHLSFSATHWESLKSGSSSLFYLISPGKMPLIFVIPCLRRQHFSLLDTDLAFWPELPVG